MPFWRSPQPKSGALLLHRSATDQYALFQGDAAGTALGSRFEVKDDARACR